MRGWWREKDFSAVLKEQLITCEMDANSIVAKVYADLLKEEQKMRHDIIEYAEISPVIGRTVTVTVDRPLGSYQMCIRDSCYCIQMGKLECIPVLFFSLAIMMDSNTLLKLHHYPQKKSCQTSQTIIFHQSLHS